jgi:signal transduction histidine kinase
MRLPSLKKLGLGVRFDQERELFSLVFLSYFYISLFSLVVVLLHTSAEELVPVSYRYHGLILLGFILLLLIRIRLISLAKLLILTVTPFTLIILPSLTGLFSNEFYFWFPYVPIAMSLLPHFLLHTKKERVALISTLVAYLLLAIFNTSYMMALSDGSESIIPIVQENRFYYELIPVIIYIFVNIALGLVFARNYKYEQIMIRQQDELIQAEKMSSLGVLTTGIAHEINNPMNFISGGLHATSTLKNELLKLERKPTPKKLELYEQLDRMMENSLEGVQRVSDIVTSLKFFVNPGKAIKEEHDLNQLLYSVLWTIEKKIPSRLTLRRNIPEGTRIFCYDEQLQQVLIHILLNAIQVPEKSKMEKQRIIDISVKESRKDNQKVDCISISNNGPPIPEQELKKIFDPFYTLNNEGKGKGLGMAISYMIMKQHQGWIEARNENGLVVFDVILPKA